MISHIVFGKAGGFRLCNDVAKAGDNQEIGLKLPVIATTTTIATDNWTLICNLAVPAAVDPLPLPPWLPEIKSEG